MAGTLRLVMIEGRVNWDRCGRIHNRKQIVDGRGDFNLILFHYMFKSI